MIYLDNAATSLRKPQEVVDAVCNAMTTMGNAGRGLNEASMDAARSIFETRRLLAEFFHAEGPERIAFTMNSTESLNTAIRGLFRPGDHVITTMLEHNSVLRPLYELEEQGVELSILPADLQGKIDYGMFEKMIRPSTRGIVCTHASNLTGNLTDIERIGAIAKKHGILFIVDASQTAGVFDIDVGKMQIDVLCFTGHKGLLGPQGTGGIYVRTGLQLRPLKSGGSGIKTYDKRQPPEMPTVLEAGTLNGHGIAGLGAAIRYLNRVGLDTIRQREQALMARFYEGVCGIAGVKVYGDFSDYNRSAIVTLNIRDYDSAEIGDALYTEYGISIRSGAHCAPLMHKALGTVETGAVRFSFSHYNTEAEVDAAIAAIAALAAE